MARRVRAVPHGPVTALRQPSFIHRCNQTPREIVDAHCHFRSGWSVQGHVTLAPCGVSHGQGNHAGLVFDADVRFQFDAEHQRLGVPQNPADAVVEGGRRAVGHTPARVASKQGVHGRQSLYRDAVLAGVVCDASRCRVVLQAVNGAPRALRHGVGNRHRPRETPELVDRDLRQLTRVFDEHDFGRIAIRAHRVRVRLLAEARDRPSRVLDAADDGEVAECVAVAAGKEEARALQQKVDLHDVGVDCVRRE